LIPVPLPIMAGNGELHLALGYGSCHRPPPALLDG
jgi:hypothetical protein